MKPPPAPEIKHRQTTLGTRNVRELLVGKRRNLAGSKDSTGRWDYRYGGTATSSGVKMLRLDTNDKLQYEQLLICCTCTRGTNSQPQSSRAVTPASYLSLSLLKNVGHRTGKRNTDQPERNLQEIVELPKHLAPLIRRYLHQLLTHILTLLAAETGGKAMLHQLLLLPYYPETPPATPLLPQSFLFQLPLPF